MATKRMFSKSVVRTDRFLDMSQSAQNLYFHLGLEADDDGFVSPKMIMRMLGSTQDDCAVLVARGFIIPFDSGVIVIRHWRVNNELKSDRYKGSMYPERSNLLIDKTNTYMHDEEYDPTEIECVTELKRLPEHKPNTSLDTKRIQTGNILSPQYSKVKYSKVKNSKDKQLFWKDQKCHISPINGKIGMYDQGEWKELNENYPEDCKLLDPNGEVLAIGYDAITQFKM